MSIRYSSTPKGESLRSGTRSIDEVIRVVKPVAGKYTLFGNAKSDWAVVSYDEYDNYRRGWYDFQKSGFLQASEENDPMPRSGVRPQKDPPTYRFMTYPDYKTHSYTDYDKYLQDWQSAVDNKVLFGTMKDARDGHPLQKRNGVWERVPFAT